MRGLRLLSGLCVAACTGVAAAQDYPARVVTYAMHQGGNVLYHYEVRNNGAAEIRRFFIGCDCRAPHDARPQLQLLPVGALPERTDDFGTWYSAAPEGMRQPAGWRTRIAQPRGAKGYWIEWYMPDARPHAGIAPGRSLGGFTVILPGGDARHLDANFTVLVEGGRGSGSAPLALLDTTPPTLTLEARPPSAKPGVAVVVRIAATAKDDHDPEPRVTVEALHRVESAGQAGYQVTYSATDASGNRTTASTRVRLPPGGEVEAPRFPPFPAVPARPANLPRLALMP